MDDKVLTAVKKGVKFLLSQTKPHHTLYSPTEDWKHVDPFHAPFLIYTPAISTFQIRALALADELGIDTGGRIKQLAEVVLDERDRRGFWAFNGKENPLLCADLDDTSFALTALRYARINTDFPTIVERYWYKDEGYVTWLREDAIFPNDVDYAVNASYLHALRMYDKTDERLSMRLAQIVKDSTFVNGSIYYNSDMHFVYYLASAMEGVSNDTVNRLGRYLKNNISRFQRSGVIGSCLALSAGSMLGLGKERLKGLVGTVLSMQSKDGSWPVETFFTGGDVERRRLIAAFLMKEKMLKELKSRDKNKVAKIYEIIKHRILSPMGTTGVAGEKIASMMMGIYIPDFPNTTSYYGSQGLSTALCIEALARTQ